MMSLQLLYWILSSMVQSRSGMISGERWSYQKRTKQLYNDITSCCGSYGIRRGVSGQAKKGQGCGEKACLWVIALSLVFDTASLNIGFLTNLIMFPCKHCPEQFTALSARGLTQHHRKCPAFIRHEAVANQCQKQLSLWTRLGKQNSSNLKIARHVWALQLPE